MINTILNGDAVEELNALPENSVDLIFADPPYWLRTEGKLSRVEGTSYNGCDDDWDSFDSAASYEAFTRDWLKACRRVLKPNGSFWVIGGMQCIFAIGAVMQELGFWFINDVIWHKLNPTPNFKGTRLNNSHETLIWATKSKSARYTFHYKTAKELNRDGVSAGEFENGARKQMGSVWRFPVCAGGERLKDENGNKLHSTQKPEAMLYRIIALTSNVGDTVLDPFGGTMTTAAMAKKLGRNYIMIERDKRYCEYGQRRLEAIEPEIDDIARATFDMKPKKATMSEMIGAGYFTVGENFYLKDGEKTATLAPDGRLIYEGETLDMHSCAARAKGVKAERLNGFDCWYVSRDNALVSIAAVREAYRKTLD